MAAITKELALRICRKLGAQKDVRSNRPHDLFLVYEKGVLIAYFGVRRGASKELGHDHVARALHLRPAQARLLGQCPMTKEQWLAIVREKGLI
jgi:hypothetical protein